MFVLVAIAAACATHVSGSDGSRALAVRMPHTVARKVVAEDDRNLARDADDEDCFEKECDALMRILVVRPAVMLGNGGECRSDSELVRRGERRSRSMSNNVLVLIKQKWLILLLSLHDVCLFFVP